MILWEIPISSLIYISVSFLLTLISLIGLINHRNKKDHTYFINFFFLTVTCLVYNIIEELIPHETLPINIMSQNIIAYTAGLVSVLCFLLYLSKEYQLKLIKKFNRSLLFLILICLFIIPYTTTQSLKLSRFIFLTITLSMLTFNSFSILKNQYRKFRASQNLTLKIHSVNGAMGFLSIVTLPITILLTSSNQFVVQTFYTSGFFIVSIDYFLYPLRNKIQQTPPLDIFSKREKEILYTFLLNSELTYPEISKKLFISDKTFSVHMSNIYKKAEVKGRKELYEKYKDCDIYSL